MITKFERGQVVQVNASKAIVRVLDWDVAPGSKQSNGHIPRAYVLQCVDVTPNGDGTFMVVGKGPTFIRGDFELSTVKLNQK